MEDHGPENLVCLRGSLMEDHLREAKTGNQWKETLLEDLWMGHRLNEAQTGDPWKEARTEGL